MVTCTVDHHGERAPRGTDEGPATRDREPETRPRVHRTRDERSRQGVPWTLPRTEPAGTSCTWRRHPGGMHVTSLADDRASPGSSALPCSPACSHVARTSGPSAWCSPSTWRRRSSASARSRPPIPDVRGRIELTEGDITAPDLGSARDRSDDLEDVTEVWHLAAVYDLAVDPETARRVNVDGTARILEFCRSRPRFHRLQYVSTCYVSGRYEGTFTEESLAEGQAFRNHYESTKYEAELLVRDGDGRRPAGDHLPPRHRRRRLPHRGDPEVRRPVLLRVLPAAAAVPGAGPPAGGSGRGAVLRGPEGLRHRGDGRALGAGPVGRADVRPDRSEPPDGAAARRHLRAATWASG